ncbi:MAG: transcription repressor NadR [Defluviitaleaceae bacterium]|nr:transcription repressor NadR [Defluviitaleaceae bacterium]
MDATLRRGTILEVITQSNVPISASTLAKKLNVSRQVIVGDIALLRAQGHEIVATARGYMMPEFREPNQYIGKIACCHSAENTKEELYTMVDLGAIVMDVIIEHDLYGEITGQLNIKTYDDVDIFIDRIKSSEIKLLSELKSGVHLHTIACRDKGHFEQISHALSAAGFLIQN